MNNNLINSNEIPDISSISDPQILDEILYASKSTVEIENLSSNSSTLPSDISTHESNFQPNTEVIEDINITDSHLQLQNSPISTPTSLSSSSPLSQPLTPVDALSYVSFGVLPSQTSTISLLHPSPVLIDTTLNQPQSTFAQPQLQQPIYHHQHRPPFSGPHPHQQQHQQQQQQQQHLHHTSSLPTSHPCQPHTTYLNQDSQVVQTLKFFSNDGKCDFSELPKSELEILANANFQYMQQLLLRTQNQPKSSSSSLPLPELQKIGDVTTGSALL